jgi:hypothetical protein
VSIESLKKNAFVMVLPLQLSVTRMTSSMVVMPLSTF